MKNRTRERVKKKETRRRFRFISQNMKNIKKRQTSNRNFSPNFVSTSFVTYRAHTRTPEAERREGRGIEGCCSRYRWYPTCHVGRVSFLGSTRIWGREVENRRKPKGRSLFFPVAFCSVTRDPQNGRLAACLSGN